MPADDHEIALPWASVIVIMVLLKLAFTCATPDGDVLALAALNALWFACHVFCILILIA